MKKFLFFAAAMLSSAVMMAQFSVTANDVEYTADTTINVTEMEFDEDGFDPFPYKAGVVGTVNGVTDVTVTIQRSYADFDKADAPADEFCLGSCASSNHQATQVLSFTGLKMTSWFTHCYFADQTPCTKTIAYTFTAGEQSIKLTVNYVMETESALEQIAGSQISVDGRTVTFHGAGTLYNLLGSVVATGENTLTAPKDGVYVLRMGNQVTKLALRD